MNEIYLGNLFKIYPHLVITILAVILLIKCQSILFMKKIKVFMIKPYIEENQKNVDKNYLGNGVKYQVYAIEKHRTK